MNKIFISGNLTGDPELKVTASAETMCKFTVAVNRPRFKDGDERRADFLNVVAFGALAETITKYFSKGKKILVVGEMQANPYTDRDGRSLTWYQVLAREIDFPGEKSSGGAQAQPQAQTPPQPQATSTQPIIPPSEPAPTQLSYDGTSDDYPF